MGFNYKKMQKTAQRLVGEQKFGNPFILKKVTNKKKYNPVAKKQIKVYKEYKGGGTILPIAEEAIGALANIIKAGDKKFICQMEDETIIPLETKDQVVYEGETYNILNVKSLNPNGQVLLIHTLLLRKASEALE